MIRPEYEAETIRVVFEPPLPFREVVVEVPLARYRRYQTPVIDDYIEYETGLIELDVLISTPEFYPEDSYILDYSITIKNNPHLGVILPQNEVVEGDVFTTSLSVLAEQSLSDNFLYVDTPGTTASGAVPFSIQVRRSVGNRIRVYSLALFPILFAAPLAHLLFTSVSDRGVLPALMADLIAAMLAILPLRQVLVPQQIQVLTRVDTILAINIVVLFVIAVQRYYSAMTSSGRTEGPVVRRKAERLRSIRDPVENYVIK